MPDSLVATLQAGHHWLDRHPGTRLAGGLALFFAAIAIPWPAWLLDLWVIGAFAGSLGLAAIILTVGDELRPREALSTLPAFLRRFTLHRLALSIALLKAVLAGSGAGLLLEWTAQTALRGHAGLGLVALVALAAARVAVSTFPFSERLGRAAGDLHQARLLLVSLAQQGRLTPQQLDEGGRRLADEVDALSDGRQIFALMRADAWLALACSAAMVGAVCLSSVLLRGWSWPLTATTLAPWALAEAVLTGLPALAVSAALGQWLTGALEEATERARTAASGRPTQESTVLMVEVGRELGAGLRRGWSELVAQIRSRLTRELGVPVPRVELAVQPALAPRGYRVVVRGVAWAGGELEAREGAGELADHLHRTIRLHAGDLLSLEACRAWLDEAAEAHPVTVSQALAAFELVEIQAVLRGLAEERVPLRDLAGTLEAMLGACKRGQPGTEMLAAVRQRLSLVISLGLADGGGTLHAIALGGSWHAAVADPAASPLVSRELLHACRAQWAHACSQTQSRVALIVPAELRARVSSWLRVSLPDLAVVSPEELSSHHGLRVLGTVERRAEGVVSPSLTLLKVAGS